MEIQSFKKVSDYLIHIYIQKTKEIQVPDNQSTVNPVFVIESLRQKKYSSSKDKIGGLTQIVWNEHLFLEPNSVDKRDAEAAKISIRLMDKGIFKDQMIGEYIFDLSTIYLKDKHALQHQWIALNNPASENYSQIKAYLKISISVTAAGDESIQLTEDTAVKEDTTVLMSPSLNPSFFQININLLQAQKLTPMDHENIILKQKPKIDAFIQVKRGNKSLQSKVLVQEQDGEPIEWNQQFQWPGQLPILEPEMTFQLRDEDNLNFTELSGSIILQKKEIIEDEKNHKSKLMWKNVFGAPSQASNQEHSKLMNHNPQLATAWRGRILLETSVEFTEKPVFQIVDLPKEIISQKTLYIKDREYRMIAQVGQAVSLPSTNKYNIRFTVGGHQILLKPFEQKILTNYKRYNRSDVQKVRLPYQDISEMEKILIHLMDGDTPICYFIDDINNYRTDRQNISENEKKRGPDYKWVEFKPDLSIGTITQSHLAGIFSFRFAIHDVTQNGPPIFDKQKNWIKPIPKRATPLRIRALIYMCRDLPSADSEGTSDPFIIVWDTVEAEKRTKTLYKSTNPLFYEVLELEYEVEDFNDLTSYPPFIFDCYDFDNDVLDLSPDFLGRAIIEPEDCAVITQKQFQNHEDLEDSLFVTPKWHPFYFNKDDPPQGEILVSFIITEYDFNFKHRCKDMDLQSQIKFKEMEVEMLVLGLRNLQSPGLLPVKKAYINFNLKSLMPPGPVQVSLKNIETSPQHPGPNPTINTLFKFNIELPKDPLYCPKMNCTVYDNIFKGLSQPIIGVFTLPIGDIMIEFIQEKEYEIDEMRHILEEVTKQLKLDQLIMPQSYKKSLQNNEKKSHTNINETIDKTFDQQLNQSILQSNFDLQNQSISQSNYDLKQNVFQNKQEYQYKSITNYQIEQQSLSKRSNDYSMSHEEYADILLNQKSKTKLNPDRLIKPKKKKFQKIFKDQQNNKDLNESLGANEILGNNFAEQQKNKQLRQAQDKLKILKKKKSSDSSQKTKKDKIYEYDEIPNEHDIKSESNDTILSRIQQTEQLQQRIVKDEQTRDQENQIHQGNQIFDIVIMPEYQMDQRLKIEREVDSPPQTLYIGLGWDEDSKSKRKHYRQIFDDELENDVDIFPKKSPFNSYQIKRGQTRGLDDQNIFSKLVGAIKKDSSGNSTTEQIMGIFKGLLTIQSKDDKVQYDKLQKQIIDELKKLLNELSMKYFKQPFEVDFSKLDNVIERRKFDLSMRQFCLEHLQISKHFCELESDDILRKKLLCVSKCFIRVYMIYGYDMAQRDLDSHSDTYLQLHLNDDHVSERDNYQIDQPNPDFFKHYDFQGKFPGCSPLKIEVWDYDSIFGDELIGTSIIDLEDRYFNVNWSNLDEKPIEKRKLYHPSSLREQGYVYCWIDIYEDPSKVKQWDISLKPPEIFEIRICVFKCKDIKLDDGMCDAFIRGFFDTQEDVQETDTHFRCQDGNPDFQYRYVYRIKDQRKSFLFTLQAYDRDLFKSNEMIGEAQIDIKNLVQDCQLLKKPLSLNKKYYDDVLRKSNPNLKIEFEKQNNNKFWIYMLGRKGQMSGEIQLQIDILPQGMAEKNPVGKARDTPNHSPQLPQPEGRLELTMNPIKMINQFLTAEIRRQLYFAIFIALCITMCIAILPSVMGTLIANML